MKFFKGVIRFILFLYLLLFAGQTVRAQCFPNYEISPHGTVCSSSVPIVLSGSQTGVRYQLTLNGVNVGSDVGGTGSAITVRTISNNGSSNNLLVIASIPNSTTCAPATVAGGILNFATQPGGAVSVNNTIACSGGPVTYTVNTNAYAGSYVFQWLLNGIAINGATSQTYSKASAGTYTVQLTNGCGMTTLSCPAITVAQPVGQLGIINGPVTRTAGIATSTYSTTSGANASAYLWFVSPSTAGTINGSGTSATLTWNPDFYGTAIVSVSASSGCTVTSPRSFLSVNVDLPPASSYSYVKETDVRVSNILSASALTTVPLGQKMVTYTYLDQIGRPIQKINQAATPGLNDIVQPLAYDPMGRQVTTYLPFSVPGSNNGN